MTMRHVTLPLLAGWSLAVHCFAADAQALPGRLSWSTLAALPDPHGVAGAFAGVAGPAAGVADDGGVLVVAGGANFPDRSSWDGGTKTWQDAAYVLPAPNAEWRTVTPLPRPLGYGVSASHAGRVWCVGGGDAREHLRSTLSLRWDPATGRLLIEPDALPPLPEPMSLGAGVLVGSRLYVAGGLAAPTATEALGTFWSIDLAAARDECRWRMHPGWPGPKRILPVLGTLAGTVYLVSGAELVPDTTAGAPSVTRRFLTDAYAFDPGTDAWRKLAACPVPLVAAPGPAIPLDATRLAFLPGDDGALFFRQKELAGRHPGFPRQVHVYDAGRDAWHRLDAVPEAIRPAAVTPTVAWRGAWIVPSGEVQPGVRSTQIVRIVTSRGDP